MGGLFDGVIFDADLEMARHDMLDALASLRESGVVTYEVGGETFSVEKEFAALFGLMEGVAGNDSRRAAPPADTQVLPAPISAAPRSPARLVSCVTSGFVVVVGIGYVLAPMPQVQASASPRVEVASLVLRPKPCPLKGDLLRVFHYAVEAVQDGPWLPSPSVFPVYPNAGASVVAVGDCVFLVSGIAMSKGVDGVDARSSWTTKLDFEGQELDGNPRFAFSAPKIEIVR